MKKSLSRKLAIALTAAVLATPIGMNAAPQTAKAGWENVIGAAIGGLAYSAQLNEEIKYINDTEEGRNAYFEQMKENDGVCEDWAINHRVDGIMGNLITAIGQVDGSIYDKPFQYFVNEQEDFNAYCTLGRNMSINRGVFSLTDNEAEIAVVLGHEMGHGMKDHPAKGAKRSLGPAVLAAATGGSVLGNIAANLWNNNGITKPQEWEADNLSFEYMTHTNYNPGATAAIWQRVIDQYGDNNSPLTARISDHPSNSARRDNYEKKLKEYSGGHVSVNSDGVVEVNGQTFCTPAATSSMSSRERAYFVQGNLAAAYHNGHSSSDAYADGTTVMLGAQPVLTCTDGDEDAQTLATRLNQIKDGKAKK